MGGSVEFLFLTQFYQAGQWFLWVKQVSLKWQVALWKDVIDGNLQG